MWRTSIILIVLIGLLGAAIKWRLDLRGTRPLAPSGHLMIGRDTSTSYPNDCEQIVNQQVSAAIEAVPAGKDSTFSFIVTGGGATSSYEPRLVLSGISLPLAEHGTVMRVRRGGISRAEFFKHVRAACDGLATEDSTSVYRTIEVGLAHLRPRCQDEGLCLFLIATDLGETVNRNVANYLHGTARQPDIPKLDLGYVRLVVCGYAVTAGGGAPVESGQRRLERFRSLFNGDIELLPYCDGKLGTV
jgi:hypothetical protein